MGYLTICIFREMENRHEWRGNREGRLIGQQVMAKLE
jgi:hypothetical protein